MATKTPQQVLGAQRAQDVMRRYGGGWSRIGDTFREGALAKEFVSIVLANEGVATGEAGEVFSRLAETWRAMHRKAFGDDARGVS